MDVIGGMSHAVLSLGKVRAGDGGQRKGREAERETDRQTDREGARGRTGRSPAETGSCLCAREAPHPQCLSRRQHLSPTMETTLGNPEVALTSTEE